MESIPVIDFSETNRMDNVAKLSRAMEEVGFVYLDNVPGYDKELEGKLLEACKWFFALPLEEKMALSPKKWNEHATNVYRGYVPIDLSQEHLREQYGTGEILPESEPERSSGIFLYEVTPFPRQQQEDGIKFKRLLESTRQVFVDASMEVLHLTALGLGMPEDTFDSKFLPKSVSSFRLMHYPTYEHVKGNLDTFTCEEHVDGTFVTLLVTFGSPGLEIERSDGSWLKVPPRSGSLVVNIGRLLSRLSGDKFKATKHRVRDIGMERYSLPFFFEPQSDAEFCFPDDSSSIIYGQWLTESMKKRFPYQFGHVPDYKPLRTIK